MAANFWSATHSSLVIAAWAGNAPARQPGITGCGTERWALKTGIDHGAILVNVRSSVPSTIRGLRSLPRPPRIPPRTRVRPVELSAFKLHAILLRLREQMNGDFQLVLGDGSGRTMSAGIPAIRCTGARSAFLPSIKRVRAIVTARFHPGASWRTGRWPVVVTGVGFFGRRRGDGGEAPNGIELYPVLSIKVGSATRARPLPTPTPIKRPTIAPTPNAFDVNAEVNPSRVNYGDRAALTVETLRGAVCTAGVTYSSGQTAADFHGRRQTVGSSGAVSWTWLVEDQGSGGAATVACTKDSRTKTATAYFEIIR